MRVAIESQTEKVMTPLIHSSLRLVPERGSGADPIQTFRFRGDAARVWCSDELESHCRPAPAATQEIL